jgi:very-short-patch-repair endonuclease
MPQQRPRRSPGIHVHRTRILLPRDVRQRERLPVTSPARALLDIAEQVTPRELERALDEGLTQRVVRIAQIQDVLDRANGRRGVSLLKALIRQRRGSTLTRSEAEELFLSLVRAAGLPEPELNQQLDGYTVDFLWRALRVIFEIDGYRFHTSRSAFMRDRRKDGAMKAAGYDMNRLARDQLVEEPYAVIARVTETLTRAQAAA